MHKSMLALTVRPAALPVTVTASLTPNCTFTPPAPYFWKGMSISFVAPASTPMPMLILFMSESYEMVHPSQDGGAGDDDGGGDVAVPLPLFTASTPPWMRVSSVVSADPCSTGTVIPAETLAEAGSPHGRTVVPTSKVSLMAFRTSGRGGDPPRTMAHLASPPMLALVPSPTQEHARPGTAFRVLMPGESRSQTALVGGGGGAGGDGGHAGPVHWQSSS